MAQGTQLGTCGTQGVAQVIQHRACGTGHTAQGSQHRACGMWLVAHSPGHTARGSGRVPGSRAGSVAASLGSVPWIRGRGTAGRAPARPHQRRGCSCAPGTLPATDTRNVGAGAALGSGHQVEQRGVTVRGHGSIQELPVSTQPLQIPGGWGSAPREQEDGHGGGALLGGSCSLQISQ